MTMMNPNVGAMHAASLPPVWRTPPGQSMSPAQYAQSKGQNWSQAVNNPQFMQGYYGGNDDYSGGRYVPPTYRMGYDSSGNIDPNAMQWNTQRNYYTPEQNYRFPTMPNFGMMEGMGNFGMNPFQQMMQMQQMGWLMGGRGGPWSGGGMDYSGGMGRPGAADLFRRGGGGEQNPYGYDQEAADADPEGFARWMEAAQAQGINPQAMSSRGSRGGMFDGGGGGSYEDYVQNYRPEQRDPNMMYTAEVRPGRDVPLSREDWELQQGGRRGGLSGNAGGGRFGGYRPRMPQFSMGGFGGMFGGGMFSPYFGFGGLGGMLPGGFGQRPQRPNQQAGLKPATLPQSGPPAPGGG